MKIENTREDPHSHPTEVWAQPPVSSGPLNAPVYSNLFRAAAAGPWPPLILQSRLRLPALCLSAPIKPEAGESLVMMSGCARVCSDPPVVSGYRTNTTLSQVLGGNGVKHLHGDDPQQTSSCPPAANEPPPWLPVHSSLWAWGCSTVGNRGWGNFTEQFAPYSSGLGVQKTDSSAVSWGWICKACSVFERPWCW